MESHGGNCFGSKRVFQIKFPLLYTVCDPYNYQPFFLEDNKCIFLNLQTFFPSLMQDMLLFFSLLFIYSGMIGLGVSLYYRYQAGL